MIFSKTLYSVFFRYSEARMTIFLAEEMEVLSLGAVVSTVSDSMLTSGVSPETSSGIIGSSFGAGSFFIVVVSLGFSAALGLVRGGGGTIFLGRGAFSSSLGVRLITMGDLNAREHPSKKIRNNKIMSFSWFIFICALMGFWFID